MLTVAKCGSDAFQTLKTVADQSTGLQAAGPVKNAVRGHIGGGPLFYTCKRLGRGQLRRSCQLELPFDMSVRQVRYPVRFFF